MTHFRSIAGKPKFFIVFSFLIFSVNTVFAQDGKALFLSNCASCHDPKFQKTLTGPNLAGVEDRWPDRNKLKEWIHNNQALIKTGYPRALEVYAEYNKTAMNLFTDKTDAEIEAILAYIKAGPPKTDGPKTPDDVVAEEGDSSLVFGILTLILAIVAFVMLQVNANLKKLADDKEGVPSAEPLPFWRNKTYIMFFALVLFMIGGYYTTKGAIGLGRQKDYQPVQPIFYSHKVHAGTNQVNCLYCHGGAQEGKHANIPSVNICMNCHMAINEYNGPQLYDGDHKEISGTNEIKKLYKYAGFVPGQPWDASKAKPIEWVKIHSLPDHVYFNHSQHVTVGKVACQNCHGEIQKMDEVKQFAELSMGWCINCHRQTKVKFDDNGFYSIYEKFHDDLKNGKMDSVTVRDIGGTECQKCHY